MKLPNTNDAARINDDFSYMFADIGRASDPRFRRLEIWIFDSKFRFLS